MQAYFLVVAAPCGRLSKMTTYGERLESALKAKRPADKNARQWLADQLGISVQAVGQVLSGKTKALTAENHEKAALALGCSGFWLATGAGHLESASISPGPDIRGAVPLISGIQAGMFKEFVDNFHPGDGGEELVPTSVPIKQHTFALRVENDSMEPLFTAGMVLIVEPEMDPMPNDYVIAKNGEEETTFKQLIKDGSEWFLKPLNPRYPIKSMEGAKVIGVVRAVERRFR